MEKHAIIKANGIATHVFDEGAGDALVMLHGWAATSDSWQAAFDALKADHRVIAPDLPGHGRTAGGWLPYGLGFMRRWLTDVLDALGVPQVTLLGNSLGGALSLAFARAQPERVSRLVAVDALGMSDRIPYSTAGHMIRRFPNLVRLAFTRKLDPYLMRYLSGMVVLDPWAQREIIFTMTELNLKRGLTSLWSGTRVLLSDFSLPGKRRKFVRDLTEIQIPTLIVWGRHDGLLPVAHAFSGLEYLRDARVCVFEKSAHMPMMEEPDGFIDIVRAFLKNDLP